VRIPEKRRGKILAISIDEGCEKKESNFGRKVDSLRRGGGFAWKRTRNAPARRMGDDAWRGMEISCKTCTVLTRKLWEEEKGNLKGEEIL